MSKTKSDIRCVREDNKKYNYSNDTVLKLKSNPFSYSLDRLSTIWLIRIRLTFEIYWMAYIEKNLCSLSVLCKKVTTHNKTDYCYRIIQSSKGYRLLFGNFIFFSTTIIISIFHWKSQSNTVLMMKQQLEEVLSNFFSLKSPTLCRYDFMCMDNLVHQRCRYNHLQLTV